MDSTIYDNIQGATIIDDVLVLDEFAPQRRSRRSRARGNQSRSAPERNSSLDEASRSASYRPLMNRAASSRQFQGDNRFHGGPENDNSSLPDAFQDNLLRWANAVDHIDDEPSTYHRSPNGFSFYPERNRAPQRRILSRPSIFHPGPWGRMPQPRGQDSREWPFPRISERTGFPEHAIALQSTESIPGQNLPVEYLEFFPADYRIIDPLPFDDPGFMTNIRPVPNAPNSPHISDRFGDVHLNEMLEMEEPIGNLNRGIHEIIIQKSLKKEKYASAEASGGKSCSICLEEYKDGEVLAMLDCGHDFHATCIGKWLGQNNVCPICKKVGLPN